jgi:hypothetical protein
MLCVECTEIDNKMVVSGTGVGQVEWGDMSQKMQSGRYVGGASADI